MSNYPEKIDSSIELPLVRNNILEAGSEAINSIRSAVVNIERALGISPQGEKRSLSERVSVSLDPSGNLKQSALTNLNIISGPVENKDISASARILESKLDLDYSTEYLNTQIKIISSSIDSVYSAVSDISAKLTLHLSSLDAHKAESISLNQIYSSEKSTANTFPLENVQNFLDESLNSHYNFSGPATSTNKSHSSNQIYVDSSSIDGASSDNLQDVLSELSTKGQGSVANFIHNYKNSHFPKRSVIGDRYLNDNILHENVDISYSKYNPSSGKSGSVVSMSAPFESRMKTGDLCEIFEEKYVISSITYSSNLVSSVFLENFFPDSQSLNVSVNFISKIKDISSEPGLIFQSVENPITSDKSFVQIVNPNSPYVIASSSPKYSELQASNSMAVNVNGTSYTISCGFFSDIYTCIDLLNEDAISKNAPILFFNFEGKIAISSLLVFKNSYISLDSSSEIFGFSNTENNYGNTDGIILIGREEKTEIRKVLDGAFLCENNRVFSSTIDFLSLGISTSSYLIVNNKRYFIESVSASNITLFGANFASATHQVYCFDDSSSISMFSLDNVFGALGFEGALIKGYLDSDFRLSIFKFGDFLVPIDQSQRSELLVDFDVDTSDISDENVVIRFQIDNASDDTIYVISGDSKIPYFGKYSYFGDNNIEIFSDNLNALNSHIEANQSSYPKFVDVKINLKSVPYYDKIDLFSIKINKSSKYIYEGNVEVNRGYLEKENISFSLDRNQNYERSLLHSNSIISGFEISSVSLVNGFYTINIESGKYIYKGKIHEISNSEIQTRIEASLNDNIFVYIDSKGIPSAVAATSNLNSGSCSFPLDTKTNIILGSVEYVSGNLSHYSLLNYHIDANDLVIGNIFVDPERGSVKTIRQAVEICRKYYNAFGRYPGKIILSPTSHKVGVDYSGSDLTSADYTSAAWNAGIYIDFPITIEGSGFRTSIDAFTLGSSDRVDRFADVIINFSGDSFVPGGQVSGKVIFKDLTFENTGVQIKNNNPAQADQSLLDNFVEFESVKFILDDNSNNSICRVFFNNNDITLVSGNCTFRNCDFSNYNVDFGNADGSIIHGLCIEGCRFKFQSSNFGIDYSSGEISFYDTNSYFFGFLPGSIPRKNNFFSGNRLLSSCSSAIAPNLSELIFETDFSAQKSAGRGFFSEKLRSYKSFESNGSSRFDGGDVLFNDMSVVRFVGDNIVELRNYDSNLTAIKLLDGKIEGFQKVRYSNTFDAQIVNEDTPTQVFRYAFNFFENSIKSTYVYNMNNEVDWRLCSNRELSSPTYLRNIQICPGLVPDGENYEVRVTIAHVQSGTVAFSSTPTYARGVRAFATSVATATTTVSVGSENSFSSINVDIDDAISQSSEISSRVLGSTKDLCLTFDVYFPSGGETTATQVKFNIILDVDVK